MLLSVSSLRTLKSLGSKPQDVTIQRSAPLASRNSSDGLRNVLHDKIIIRGSSKQEGMGVLTTFLQTKKYGGALVGQIFHCCQQGLNETCRKHDVRPYNPISTAPRKGSFMCCSTIFLVPSPIQRTYLQGRRGCDEGIFVRFYVCPYRSAIEKDIGRQIGQYFCSFCQNYMLSEIRVKNSETQEATASPHFHDPLTTWKTS